MGAAQLLAEKKRQQFLGRASSRKDLAMVIHEFVLPELVRLNGNLEFLRKRLDALQPQPVEPSPTSEAE